MKKAITLMAGLALCLLAYNQPTIEAGGGFSPRYAGRVVMSAQLNQHLYGPEHASFSLLAGAMLELGTTRSAHLAASAQWYELRFFGGAALQQSRMPELPLRHKVGPMGGIAWQEQYVSVELRYQATALALQFLFVLHPWNN